jgi:O-antigen/teichoic acid export membrane protein
MGIIEKQATKSAIYSYLGAVLGFVTVTFSSYVLSPEENGLTRLLLSYAILMAQFSGLGFNTITLRFFPYFKNQEKGHHGFLFYGIAITLLGFALSLGGYLLFKNELVAQNLEKSILFAKYSYYILPLTFFTLFFNLFDYYLRACYSSVIGASSKDFTQRILILITLAAFFFKLISFTVFVFTYVLAVSIPTIILLYYIIKLNEWHVKPVKGFIDKTLRIDMIKLGAYSILAGGGGILMANIDILMINNELGLAQAGIFGVAFYFGTIIIIPSRSLIRIATSIVAEAFKKNSMVEISSIYKKSCNTQLTIGLLLYIGIYCNINNIMLILPPAYRGGEAVILLIGLGYLLDMATGINTVIMLTSKHYRYDGYFMFFSLLLAVGGNYLLIPKYGITGSAAATAFTLAVYNILRWLFLYYTYNLQPYDINTLKLLAIGLFALLMGTIIPIMENFIIDIAIRSATIGGLFILLLLKLDASPEINAKIRKNLIFLPLFNKL